MNETREALERQIARLFVCGFEGTQPDTQLSDLLQRGLGGVILFSRNLPDLDTALDLNRLLIEQAKSPLLICLDQEGGRVQRLPAPILQLPAMRRLGSSGDADLCQAVGKQLGSELAAAGFHLNLAPVLDVDSNPNNPVIGDRAFGQTPEVVARLGVAFGEGLQEGGVAACAKHFPGHGDTYQDSHLTLPDLDVDISRLNEHELLPFKVAVEAGIATFMTAHLRVSALDPSQACSLSESNYWLARAEVGFTGPILTDDLEMKAVADDPGVVKAALMAVGAGADMVLICNNTTLATEAIAEMAAAVENGDLPQMRIEQANHRLNRLYQRFAFDRRWPDPALLGELINSPTRRALEQRLAALALVT
jgi:beta-N-acetylhexosaminidase